MKKLMKKSYEYSLFNTAITHVDCTNIQCTLQITDFTERKKGKIGG